jgi:hypothetical protein
VVVQGIVSNDPKSYCSHLVAPGIGFVGHFKSGKPFGICWRELIGGGWIYGEVDQNGHFTGIKFKIALTLSVFKINYEFTSGPLKESKKLFIWMNHLVRN